jgi:hypothetical protein
VFSASVLSVSIEDNDMHQYCITSRGGAYKLAVAQGLLEPMEEED